MRPLIPPSSRRKASVLAMEAIHTAPSLVTISTRIPPFCNFDANQILCCCLVTLSMTSENLPTSFELAQFLRPDSLGRLISDCLGLMLSFVASLGLASKGALETALVSVSLYGELC